MNEHAQLSQRWPNRSNNYSRTAIVPTQNKAANDNIVCRLYEGAGTDVRQVRVTARLEIVNFNQSQTSAARVTPGDGRVTGRVRWPQ